MHLPFPRLPSLKLHSKKLSYSYHLQLHTQLVSHSLAPNRPTTPICTPNLKFSSSPSKASSRSALIARHFTTQTPQSQKPTPKLEMAQLPVSQKGYNTKAPSKFAVRKIGQPNTLEHRIFIEKDGLPVSPFHDIDLYANEQQTILNMIVEIPRWTNGKMEVSFLGC